MNSMVGKDLTDIICIRLFLKTNYAPMINKENIKTFVQQTLGCGCPEEVFHYIDCQVNSKLHDTVSGSKINIGNRLLIYVVEINHSDSIIHILPSLVDSGKRERDDAKFNRFRLVLVSDDIDKIKQVADDMFKTIEKDERIHLHLVLKTAIPKLSVA